MKNQARTRRIPSYVTTQEDQINKEAQTTNTIVMGLLIASVALTFISTLLSIANLFNGNHKE